MTWPKGSKRVRAWLGLFLACALFIGLCRFQTISGEKNAGYYPLSPPGLIITRGPAESFDEVMAHTLSVVELNKNGYRFWGYYTAQGGTNQSTDIGLAYSNDLVTWVKYGSPVVKHLRWGTVVVVDGNIHMFGTRNYGNDSYIVRLSSEDGTRFTQQETVVPAVPGQCHQNPFIFYDEKNQMFRLYYFHDSGNLHNLEEKHADEVTGLAVSPSNLVLSDNGNVLAAPSVFYREGSYWLTAETCPEIYGVPTWQTLAFVSNDPIRSFTPVKDSPILVNDEACFFPYVFDNRLIGTYSHRSTDGTWQMYRRTYDFKEKNRLKMFPATAQLKPGENQQLTAVFYEPRLRLENITDHATWATSDHQAVTVRKGMVSACQAGTALITVSYGGVSATAQVNVAE